MPTLIDAPVPAAPTATGPSLTARLAPAWRSLASALAAALRRARQRARRAAVERASRRELHALGDAALRDLGLARSELDRLAAEVSGRVARTHPRIAPHPEEPA